MRTVILLVAADDLIRMLWTRELRESGYQSLEARTGRHALDLLGTVRPDLIVLDLPLAEASDDGVWRALRHAQEVARLPVLIVGDVAGQPADLWLHVVGRLPKPQSLETVVDAVRAGLAMRPAK